MSAQPGNIDVSALPAIRNPDGSVSTVRSVGVNIDGKEVLIPTVVNGKIVSNGEAVAEYRRTGKHLGKFDSPEEANAFAQNLHEQEARRTAMASNWNPFDTSRPFGPARTAPQQPGSQNLTPQQMAGILHQPVQIGSTLPPPPVLSPAPQPTYEGLSDYYGYPHGARGAWNSVNEPQAARQPQGMSGMSNAGAFPPSVPALSSPMQELGAFQQGHLPQGVMTAPPLPPPPAYAAPGGPATAGGMNPAGAAPLTWQQVRHDTLGERMHAGHGGGPENWTTLQNLYAGGPEGWQNRMNTERDLSAIPAMEANRAKIAALNAAQTSDRVASADRDRRRYAGETVDGLALAPGSVPPPPPPDAKTQLAAMYAANAGGLGRSTERPREIDTSVDYFRKNDYLQNPGEDRAAFRNRQDNRELALGNQTFYNSGAGSAGERASAGAALDLAQMPSALNNGETVAQSMLRLGLKPPPDVMTNEWAKINLGV